MAVFHCSRQSLWVTKLGRHQLISLTSSKLTLLEFEWEMSPTGLCVSGPWHVVQFWGGGGHEARIKMEAAESGP